MISWVFIWTAKLVWWWHTHSPINLLIAHTRTMAGFWWTIPAFLLAGPLLVLAATCTAIANNSGQKWWYLIFFWALWAGVKLAVNPLFAITALIAHKWDAHQRPSAVSIEHL